MTLETWVIFLSTNPWVLRVMVVVALVTTASILYAVATYAERIWSKKPRQSESQRGFGQAVVSDLRPNLKCYS